MGYTIHASTHEQVTSGAPTPLTETRQPPIGASPSQQATAAAALPGLQEHGTAASSALPAATAAIRVGDVVWAPIPCPGMEQVEYFAMALVLPDAGPPMMEPTTSPGCELGKPRCVEQRQHKEAEEDEVEEEEEEEEEDYVVPRPRKRRAIQPWAAGKAFDYAR